MDCLNKKLCQIRSDRPATDEQICVTYVRHHIKVHKKDKHHRFVYEVLCCDMRFGHGAEIYSGQENDHKFWKTEEPDMGAGGSSVI